MAHNFSNSNEKMSYDLNFAPITINEVCEALKKINTKKATGPDGLDSYFLLSAADYIAKPLSHFFNLTL